MCKRTESEYNKLEVLFLFLYKNQIHEQVGRLFRHYSLNLSDSYEKHSDSGLNDSV